MNKKPIKCDCGKIIAYYKDGKIYLWCKQCKREIEINIKSLEP